MSCCKIIHCFALLFASGTCVLAQPNTKLLRHADVSDSHIVFRYAASLWIVPKRGGEAKQLVAMNGGFPRFSPNNKNIAFTADEDVYVMEVSGKKPVRMTHHPLPDIMVDWFPDGKSLLFSSGREFPVSAYRPRATQLFRVNLSGGLAERLPISAGQYAAISPNGKAVAVQPRIRNFWQFNREEEDHKRYRGGLAPDIWIYDLATAKSENISDHEANDEYPMWHGDTLYFLSDRDKNQRSNIWAYDLKTGLLKQLTFFENFDIQRPSIGPSDIVFEIAGSLYLFDLASGNYQEVPIALPRDTSRLLPRCIKVSRNIQQARLSPDATKALFESRGEVFVISTGNDSIQNLTQSSGTAERFPAWSPDGQSVSYFSDLSGEYELTFRSADGSGNERRISSFGPGFRYSQFWSPTGKYISFLDERSQLQLVDVQSGATLVVDKCPRSHLAASRFKISWSPDGQLLAYDKQIQNSHNAIFIYEIATGKKHQVTSGFYNETEPVFDSEGRYMYYFTKRPGNAHQSDIDENYMFINSTKVAATPLRSDTPLLLTRRPEENISLTKEEKKIPPQQTVQTHSVAKIDFTKLEARAELLPIEAGNYRGLAAAPGKIIIGALPRTGANDLKTRLFFYDVKDRSQKNIIEGIQGFELSSDGKNLLVWKGNEYALIDVQPEQRMAAQLQTDKLEMCVDPIKEWRQIFNDTWRLTRDMFYDPQMHQVDWQNVREKYEPLLERATSREDVNKAIGEMLSELNCSHFTFGGGGMEPYASSASNKEYEIGLLGADLSFDHGFFRIKKIIDGAPWDNLVRSPLIAAGVNEGDYLLQVNGLALDTKKDPWAAFEGLSEKNVTLTVNKNPSLSGARKVMLQTINLEKEKELRYLAWIESNQKKVDVATGGKAGYIYIINTSPFGYTELARQFMAQRHKDALIFDVRYNHGGMIPYRFIELISRKQSGFDHGRPGYLTPLSPSSRVGPQVMIVNELSGSGGDFFPYLFREAKLGPIIGTRTWGGAVGVGGTPPLIDGGYFAIPTFPIFKHDGSLPIEGHGVAPDIEIKENLNAGMDVQLDGAVEEVLRLLKATPPVEPKPPVYLDMTPTRENGQ